MNNVIFDVNFHLFNSLTSVPRTLLNMIPKENKIEFYTIDQRKIKFELIVIQ
jgi:hypothetical protein